MKKPVYGFEKDYEIDENGVLYIKDSQKIKEISKHASVRIDRYRLVDKKYYDRKYLVYKTFFEEEDVEVNDNRIIFINGDCRDNSLKNLKLIDKSSREEICLALKEKYGENIKPFEDYKNYYISENGNVYSYYKNNPKKLKPYVGTDGYYQVKIPDNFGCSVHIKIHKWVATYFVENKNPNEFHIVHHKDENKLNNNYLNLEWTTLTQNTRYSIGKKCCMLDENNCILSIHDTISDLSRFYGVDSSTASKQCNGKKKQFTGGLKARFFDEQNHNFISTKFD